MSKKPSAVIILILLLVSIGRGQQGLHNHLQPADSGNGNLSHFEKAVEIGADETEPIRFEFSLDGYRYFVNQRGAGKRTNGTSDARAFQLRLERSDNIVHIFYAEYQNNLLLVCEVADGESGAGFITKLDGRTLHAKWRRVIPSFNIGRGLIEEDYAYLTALGFIGKLDLRQGAYIWKHDNLFRGGDTFNDFELPQLVGATVFFKEITIYESPAKIIKVNKRNGKILSIGN